jgi:CheY-like chemotaxis protein
MSILAGRRILVVEDEFLISAMLCDMLDDSAAIVVGPANSVAEAMRLVQDSQIDGAILDMNLNGQWSDPIAEALQGRGIPFVFTTGYGANERSDRFGARTIAKPYAWETVEHELGLSLAEVAAPRSD